MELPPEVSSLFAEQYGLALRSQLLEAGLTKEALRWRLGRTWASPLPRVIATFRTAPDRRQRLLAAQLYAGAGAVVGSAAAAAWHGVSACLHEVRVVVEVPAGRAPRGARWVVVRRTSRPETSPWLRGPLRLAAPARAVAAAARDCLTPDRARAVVIEALQRRIVRVEDLWAELEAGPSNGARRLRSALDEAERGAWSVPEADLMALVRGSSVLPEPVANPRLVTADGGLLPIPDLWFPDVGLAVQMHSRLYHAGADDWDATVMRDGVFAEHGVLLLAVTPTGLERRPGEVLRRIEAAYRAASGRARPEVRVRAA